MILRILFTSLLILTIISLFEVSDGSHPRRWRTFGRGIVRSDTDSKLVNPKTDSSNLQDVETISNSATVSNSLTTNTVGMAPTVKKSGTFAKVKEFAPDGYKRKPVLIDGAPNPVPVSYAPKLVTATQRPGRVNITQKPGQRSVSKGRVPSIKTQKHVPVKNVRKTGRGNKTADTDSDSKLEDTEFGSSTDDPESDVKAEAQRSVSKGIKTQKPGPVKNVRKTGTGNKTADTDSDSKLEDTESSSIADDHESDVKAEEPESDSDEDGNVEVVEAELGSNLVDPETEASDEESGLAGNYEEPETDSETEEGKPGSVLSKLEAGVTVLKNNATINAPDNETDSNVPNGQEDTDSEEEVSIEEISSGGGRPGDVDPLADVNTNEIEEEEIDKPENYEEIVKMAATDVNRTETFTELDTVEAGAGKAGMKDSYYRWPYQMKIQIDPEMPAAKKKQIKAAIFTLKEEMKCFKFVVVSAKSKILKEDYLFIKYKKNNLACNSGLGRWGGKMVMTITNGCTKLYGTAMHELMHTLGFFHEHLRPDRDNWVEIDWASLKTEAQKAPWVIPKDQIAFADSYDFDSILHYPFSSILKAKGKVPAWAQVGQRSHLSGGDKLRLSKMYPCDKAPKPNITEVAKPKPKVVAKDKEKPKKKVKGKKKGKGKKSGKKKPKAKGAGKNKGKPAGKKKGKGTKKKTVKGKSKAKAKGRQIYRY